MKLNPQTQLVLQRIKPWGMPNRSTLRLNQLHSIKPRFVSIANYATSESRRKLFGFSQRFFIGDAAAGQKKVRVKDVWSKIEKDIRAQNFTSSVTQKR
jgi:hypothetical protein